MRRTQLTQKCKIPGWKIKQKKEKERNARRAIGVRFQNRTQGRKEKNA
jgi:hypothetical protein